MGWIVSPALLTLIGPLYSVADVRMAEVADGCAQDEQLLLHDRTLAPLEHPVRELRIGVRFAQNNIRLVADYGQKIRYR